MNVNFHAEKHGKSHLDQHFSVISSYLKTENLTKKINSTHDIVNTILKRQQASNIERIKNELSEINLKCFDLSSRLNNETSNANKNQLVIHNLRSYYNFSSKRLNGDFIIESTIFSDLENKVELRPDSNNKLKLELFENTLAKNKPKMTSYMDKKRKKIETHNVDIQINNKLISSSKTVQNKSSNEPCYMDIKRRKIEADNVGIQIKDTLISSAKTIPNKSSNEAKNEIIDFLNNMKNNKIKKYNFCIGKYKSCKCTRDLDFSFSDINNMNQFEVNKKLGEHGHPLSRDIFSKKKRKRRVDEAKHELRFHLINFHRNKLAL